MNCRKNSGDTAYREYYLVIEVKTNGGINSFKIVGKSVSSFHAFVIYYI